METKEKRIEKEEQNIEGFQWRRTKLPAAYAAAVMAIFVLIWVVVVLFLLKCSWI
jgi:DNA-binding ferritin-like protein (Dps family)